MSVFFTKRGTPPSLGKKASDYAVGDSVFLPVNGVNTEFLVVHQGNPDSTIYDVSGDGTWLFIKDCYESEYWHSSHKNDYANSTIHAYLNGTFFNLLGASAQNAVKQVKIPYRPGSGTSKTCNTGVNGLSAKIFLLSMAEVGLESLTDYAPTNEGTKLSYFTEGSTGNSRRIANLNGSATVWWLRSPRCYGSASTGAAFDVKTDGTAGSTNCHNSYGIRPALVINSDTFFDPNTNIIKG